MKKISPLISCSSINKPLHSHEQKKVLNQKVTPDQVNLSIDSVASEKAVDLAPQEETVRVGDRGGDVYSSVYQAENYDQAANKKLKIGLNFGPGIYRTINYVSVLKILERQNLSPDIITGTGLGAIVAAMYAIGMTPEVIEWNFYKYFKEKSKNKL
jgi:hypothetical protein